MSLNSATAVRAGEKNSIISNRKSTMNPVHYLLSPPKCGSKGEFLHLVLRFISSLQVIVGTSNLVCGLNIASPILYKITLIQPK